MGNFMVSDMALGRQGCPLFAALDSLLQPSNRETEPSRTLAAEQISLYYRRGTLKVAMALIPAGPGNVYINAAVQYFTNGEKEYDKGGAVGREER